MWLGRKRGYLQDWITQAWVKTTGRRFYPEKESWLTGPSGNTREIKDEYIFRLCKTENLRLEKNQPDFGLIDEINEWQLPAADEKRLHPTIIDFYTHTYNYGFEVKSTWKGIFYPFGWLLAFIFSRRLQQLNLPLTAEDTAQGLESNLIKLFSDDQKRAKYTIWYRTQKKKGTVVFSGIYGYTFVPAENRTCLKIVFPLPNGNATIILNIQVLENGSLRLTSKGKRDGETGFYFLLENGKGDYWVKYVKAMHETLDVFVDEGNTLKATHTFKFYGLTFMTLHYTMHKKQL